MAQTIYDFGSEFKRNKYKHETSSLIKDESVTDVKLCFHAKLMWKLNREAEAE